MRLNYLFLIAILLFVISCKKSTAPVSVIKGNYTLDTLVPYGTDPAQTANIYLPAKQVFSQSPVILLVHGGGWVRGQAPAFGGSDMYDFFTENGYAIVDMNYRLANAFTYPAQLNDISLLLNFMEKQASAWHIDASRICIFGQSSGAHLSLLYAYGWNSKGKIKAVIDAFGPTDLPDSSVLTDHLVTDLTTFMGVSYQANPQLWKEASPIFHMGGAVPTIIFQGTLDSTVHPIQSDMLNDSLEANGIPHQYYRLLGCGHGWSEYYWNQNQGGVLLFLGTYL